MWVQCTVMCVFSIQKKMRVSSGFFFKRFCSSSIRDLFLLVVVFCLIFRIFFLSTLEAYFCLVSAVLLQELSPLYGKFEPGAVLL